MLLGMQGFLEKGGKDGAGGERDETCGVRVLSANDHPYHEQKESRKIDAPVLFGLRRKEEGQLDLRQLAPLLTRKRKKRRKRI